MKRAPDRRRNDTRYFLQFAGTAVLLLAATLVLVLFVLPQRFVLSAGFQEGSMNFPNPATPFEPLQSPLVAARPMPDANTFVGRGPAELFWEEVLPLLEQQRWADAVPLFASYLGDYPDDDGVRREYAITLTRAGQGTLAVPLFERLLRRGEDRQLRLLLARTLRDLGRTREAVEQYETLAAQPPFDETVALEWVRALAWDEEYDEAIEATESMLERAPDSVSLRIELARLYFYTDRLEEAHALLADLTDAELALAGATELRSDVLAALTPPPVDPVVQPEPSTLEQALRARDEGRLDEADRLYRAALSETPTSPDAWRAFADFLQYERNDLAEALRTLVEVESLENGGDSELQARMAQLEIWLGQNEAAAGRLERLLAVMDREAAGEAPAPRESPHSMSRQDVLATLGDLHRWEGERIAAANRYEEALTAEPGHEGAIAGKGALLADLNEFVNEAERPAIGVIAYTFTDTERYDRVDLGGEWRGTSQAWAWGTRSGGRFLNGFDATRADATARGAFADIEGARWLRWGSVRLGFNLGVQSLRSSTVDLSVGGSVRFVGQDGRSTRLAYDHSPAFLETNTLQSELADVSSDQITIEHGQSLTDRWTVAASAGGMLLDHKGVAGSERNLRLAGAASLQRAVTRTVSVGVATRAVMFSDAAPDPAAFPLYWDPNASVSLGPVLQYSRRIDATWQVLARANPGIAYLNERSSVGSEILPDIAANAGIVRDGDRFRTAVEVYYGQGRLTGYRSLGINVSLSAVHRVAGGGR